MIALIYCVNNRGYIGKNNNLMYNIPADMRRFKELTKNHTVLMGRHTWESLPEMFRPLPSRQNVVLTSDLNYTAVGATVVFDLEKYLEPWKKGTNNKLFVIGGGKLIDKCQEHTHEAYITYVDDDAKGDVVVKPLDRSAWLPTYKETFPATSLSPAYMFTSFSSMVNKAVSDF